MKKILMLVMIVSIILIGCGKKDESGPVTTEKIKKTIHHVAGKTIDGEETIKGISYKDNNLVISVKQYTISKGILLSKSEQLFRRLYNYEGIDKVTIYWEGIFVDTFGNEEYKPVMTIGLTKENADKIQWDNFDSDNLEILADEYKIDPQLDTK